MRRGVRWLFILLVVAGAAFAAQAGRMVTVEPATPIFRAPSFDAPLIGIAGRAFQAEEKAEKLILVSRHPLARYHRFSELLLPDGQTGYVNFHLTAPSGERSAPATSSSGGGSLCCRCSPAECSQPLPPHGNSGMNRDVAAVFFSHSLPFFSASFFCCFWSTPGRT